MINNGQVLHNRLVIAIMIGITGMLMLKSVVLSQGTPTGSEFTRGHTPNIYVYRLTWPKNENGQHFESFFVAYGDTSDCFIFHMQDQKAYFQVANNEYKGPVARKLVSDFLRYLKDREGPDCIADELANEVEEKGDCGPRCWNKVTRRLSGQEEGTVCGCKIKYDHETMDKWFSGKTEEYQQLIEKPIQAIIGAPTEDSLRAIFAAFRSSQVTNAESKIAISEELPRTNEETDILDTSRVSPDVGHEEEKWEWQIEDIIFIVFMSIGSLVLLMYGIMGFKSWYSHRNRRIKKPRRGKKDGMEKEQFQKRQSDIASAIEKMLLPSLKAEFRSVIKEEFKPGPGKSGEEPGSIEEINALVNGLQRLAEHGIQIQGMKEYKERLKETEIIKEMLNGFVEGNNSLKNQMQSEKELDGRINCILQWAESEHKERLETQRRINEVKGELSSNSAKINTFGEVVRTLFSEHGIEIARGEELNEAKLALNMPDIIFEYLKALKTIIESMETVMVSFQEDEKMKQAISILELKTLLGELKRIQRQFLPTNVKKILEKAFNEVIIGDPHILERRSEIWAGLWQRLAIREGNFSATIEKLRAEVLWKWIRIDHWGTLSTVLRVAELHRIYLMDIWHKHQSIEILNAALVLCTISLKAFLKELRVTPASIDFLSTRYKEDPNMRVVNHESPFIMENVKNLENKEFREYLIQKVKELPFDLVVDVHQWGYDHGDGSELKESYIYYSNKDRFWQSLQIRTLNSLPSG